MYNIYEGKGVHDFFLAQTCEQFVDLFKRRAGCSAIDIVGIFVELESVVEIVLGGSIPLGIASDVSDIDLLVLIDGVGKLRSPEAFPDSAVVFESEYSSISSHTIVLVYRELEIEIELIPISQYTALNEKLLSGGKKLTADEKTVLSRIKRGWILYNDTRSTQLCADAENTLELHASTSEFVASLKLLEDARAALESSYILSAYLCRRAAEMAFRSYISSRGYASLGNKWLLFAERYTSTVSCDDAPMYYDALSHIKTILFAISVNSEEDALLCLNNAESFIKRIRDLIEISNRFRIAFRVCPQIYNI